LNELNIKGFISSTGLQNLYENSEVFSELGWLTSKKFTSHIVILIILMHEPTGQLIKIFSYLYFNSRF